MCMSHFRALSLVDAMLKFARIKNVRKGGAVYFSVLRGTHFLLFLIQTNMGKLWHNYHLYKVVFCFCVEARLLIQRGYETD